MYLTSSEKELLHAIIVALESLFDKSKPWTQQDEINRLVQEKLIKSCESLIMREQNPSPPYDEDF